MTKPEPEVPETEELVEEYPDTLIDRVGVSEIDPTGEEVDVEAFFARDPFLEPERRLMFAVLEQGVEDFIKFANSQDDDERRRFHRTVRWIKSDDETWPYSFVPLCHALGVDERNLRGMLNRWRRLNAPASFDAAKKR